MTKHTKTLDAIQTPYFFETDDYTVRNSRNEVVFQIVDDLLDETELRNMLNALNRYDYLLTVEAKVGETEKALEHYADELNWGLSDGQTVPKFHDWYSPVDEKMRHQKANGYDIARKALEDEKK